MSSRNNFNVVFVELQEVLTSNFFIRIHSTSDVTGFMYPGDNDKYNCVLIAVLGMLLKMSNWLQLLVTSQKSI